VERALAAIQTVEVPDQRLESPMKRSRVEQVPVEARLVVPLPRLAELGPWVPSHGMPPAVPPVEVPHDAHAGRVGVPDREHRAGHPGKRAGVGSQLVVALVVGAFAEEQEVELAQRRRKSVRVLEARDQTAAVMGLEAVREGLGGVREYRLEQSVRVDARHRTGQ
jgi:hypothetical protein